MNLLIITQLFWPENFKITDFAVSFRQRGHNVTVLTGIPNYPEGKFYKGYNFYRPKVEFYKDIKIIRTILFPRGKANGIRLFINYISFALFASIAVIFRISSHYDLIFVFEVSPITVGIPAIVLKKIRKIPIYMWVQDLWPESVYAASNLKSKIIKNWLTILVKYIYKNCDKIFVSSRGFIESIQDKGVNNAKIEYIPVWAENEYLTPIKNNIDYDSLLSKENFNIVFAGNIGEAQDFEAIVNTALQLLEYKKIKWIIIGDGRKRKWLENEIYLKKLECTIMLLGRYPVSSMAGFYSRADVLTITLKNEFIFSLTIPARLQGYLACGKPILAMCNGETARIINESNSGFSCDAGDYTSLAENILKLYNMDAESRLEMGRKAIKYNDTHFNKEKILDKIEALFYKSIKTVDSYLI